MSDSQVDFTIEDVKEIFGDQVTKTRLKAMNQHYRELVQNAFARNEKGYNKHLNSILKEYRLPLVEEE